MRQKRQKQQKQNKNKNKNKNKSKNKNELTAVDHFAELKLRIIICLVLFVIAFFVCLGFNHFFMNIFMNLGENIGYNYVVLSPQEAIVQTFKVSGMFAFFLTLPFLIYNVVAFLAPAIDMTNAVLKLIGFSIIAIIIFIIGLLFAYKILLPFVLKYLLDFTNTYSVTSEISLENYISFVCLIILCIGTMFEMPVVFSMLAKMGLVTTDLMLKFRTPAIVIIFVIAALITPPDVVSQIMVALPMCCLFSLSTWCVKKLEKKDEDA